MRKGWMRFTAAALTLGLMAGMLGGCGKEGDPGGTSDGGSGQAKVKFKLANMYADDSYEAKSMYKFKEIVESKSDNIKVEVYTNAVLGSEETIADSVRQGTVEMGVIGTTMGSYLPYFSIPEYPYLFDNYEEAKKVMSDPEFVKMTTKGTEDNGIKFLGYSPAGYRMITSNKPIKSMADLKGFRLRVPNIPIYLDWAKNLGVNGIAMSLSELFTALEQKVVDGEENPYNVIIANKYYEVQPYALESRHILTSHGWFVNQKWWDSLGEDNQKILSDAAAEAIDSCWTETEKGEQEEAAYLKEKGVTITVPDEQFKKEMKDAEAPLMDWFVKNNPGSEPIFQYVDQLKAGTN